VYAPFARLCASRAGQEGNQAEAFQVTPEQMADHIERSLKQFGAASVGPDEWKVIIAALRAVLPIDWQPTPDAINSLSAPLRRYIHHLETDCDPSGTLRENFRLRDENAALRAECSRLAELARLP
jgi:hypothetical protein